MRLTKQLTAIGLLLLLFAAACSDGTTPPVPVARVDVAPAEFNLVPGATAQLSATPRHADGTALAERPVTWSSDNTAVATVSSTGLVTAISTGGPINIIATAEGKSGTARVTVAPIPVATIDLAPATASIESGDTTRIVAVLKGAGGQSLSNRPISWSSVDPAIASVSATGLITGAAPGGPIAVTASSEGITATARVTVIVPTVASVTVAPANRDLVIGTTLQLAAATWDARGNALPGRDITWTSANPAIASVSPSGLVTAVAVGGPVAIMATSEGKQGTSAITVINIPVARIQIGPVPAEVTDGTTLQLSAQSTDSSGNVLSRPVAWSSDSVQVATIGVNGVLRTLRAGKTRVRARVDTKEATVDITVRGMTHRWTFAEEGGPGTVFVDDVRGARATLVRSGALAGSAVGGQVTLSGGLRANADYIALPPGLLRGLTDATIEVWATLHSVRNWARIFDVGSSAGNNLFMAWTVGVNASQDRTAFTIGGVEHRLDNALAPFSIDRQHQIVLSVDEGGGVGGKTRVSVFLDGSPRGSFDTDYLLRQLVDDNFWLGRSHYNDETANASYDEVRIHDRALAGADVQQAFLRGPVRSVPPVSLRVLPPAGMRDTVRGVNVRFPLRVFGRDAQGREFAVTTARFASRTPAVATIDSLGMVHAIAPGRAEFSATVGTTTLPWSAEVVRVRRLAVDPYLATPIAGALWEIPVVMVEYLPTADGATLDPLKNPDYYCLCPITLDSAETLNLVTARRRKMSVEQGSRFRGYRDAAALPSLGYRVVEHVIVYDVIPPHPTKRAGIPGLPRYEGWHQVFAETGIEPAMRTRRVREVWVAWTYFDGNFPSYNAGLHRTEDMRAFWESNMASPTTGDISNSDRDPNDLPVLPHTYIVYGVNFRRSQAEAVHNVGHQVEAMFSHVASRQDGTTATFWRDFVGQNAQGAFITGRAGWTHMPPNTVNHYDYLSKTPVASDIEDWRPDSQGVKTQVNVDTWASLSYPWPGAQEFGQRVESQWYTYWFQNMPGRGNRIPRGGGWMTNWWAFVADWDAAITSGLGLHGSSQAAARGAGAGYPHATRATGYVPLVHRPPARTRS